MKTVFLIFLNIIWQQLYSPNNMMNQFELLYSIPQEIKDTDEWPKYNLQSLYFENDTLFTLLIKNNFITSIPLLSNMKDFHHLLTPLPKNEFPLYLKRYKNEWYTSSIHSIKKFKDSLQYKTIISTPTGPLIDFFEIMDDKIVYNTRYTNVILTNLEGKELSKYCSNYFAIATTIYNNFIINGIRDILIKGNWVFVMPTKRHYTSSAYPNATYMIGGWEKYGYFVDPTQRDHLVIRDMSGNSEEECLYFNHTFSENDLDFPEEDDINLRVFSSDNQIFYFVQVKNEHLDIYKAAK
ncbi:hypothetical protein [Odoribacter laneus]|uniref:hypothetical protein n=1 Tax=Odoribacter laneus TaxID=626933 RepID=UPI00033E40E3|nr:hypothetical protein [Odoribacter laneus]CCZ80729.1 putative uncharacterized protein [Odoribacter laneus CAG:561]